MRSRRGSPHKPPTSVFPDHPSSAPAPYSGAKRHRRGERVPTAMEQQQPVVEGTGQVGFGFTADAADRAEAAVEQGVGRILLGPHAVAEALRGGRRSVQVVFLSAVERGERFKAIATLARSRGVSVRSADPELIETLAAGRTHQGIVGLAGEYPYLDLAGLEQAVAERGRESVVVALDQIQDPQNVGAILRSCVAFGVDVVVMPERRAAGVTESVVRASAGATELARIARVANLAESLRRLAASGFDVVGIDPEGEQDIAAAALRPPIAIVFGSEGPGLRRLTRELCTRRVRIPIAAGGVASLNVSVTAGIVLHAIRSAEITPGLGNG